MDAFLLFFEQMPNWEKVAWVMVCLGLSWFLEGSFPLLRLPYRKWRHAGVNSAFLLTSLLINAAFGIASVAIVAWTSASGFGLLQAVDLPPVVALLVALVVFDFVAQYVAHYLLHRVKWMWRLHVVHHSDTKVDATTGARLHPGDYALREVFALVALVLTGAPLAFYVLYRIVTIFFTFVTHANVSPPAWLDTAVSWVFVTPNMHKFHHHFERPWTDTNFGGILSVWDRIFGTFVYGDPRDVVYGVDVADPERDEDVLHQFGLPFSRKRRLDRE
ncbi:MAG: sterol desaturase family protein [Gemmatimonadota bacterium]|jgi:sterol desaturase/sphingolipid hydroxylase (fatty acid hydroxylase superfamily)